MLSCSTFCRGVKTYLLNSAKFLLDIPYFFYLFISALFISIWHRLTRRRKILDNEIILITGAASGLGQLVVLKLAKISTKAVFILWDINVAGLSVTAEKCREMGVLNVHVYVVDLSNHGDVVRTANLVRTQVGTVTTLFNNAGYSPYTLFLDMESEIEERILRINLLSQMWTIREFLPGMIKRGGGHIISTCSGLAYHRFPYLTTYVASKYGLRGFLDTLKKETDMLPEKPQINFTVIYPGWVETPMTERIIWEPRYNVDVLTKMDPEYVCKRMVQGILNVEEEVIIPSSIKYLTMMHGCLPRNFINRVESHLFKNVRTTRKEESFVV